MFVSVVHNNTLRIANAHDGRLIRKAKLPSDLQELFSALPNKHVLDRIPRTKDAGIRITIGP